MKRIHLSLLLLLLGFAAKAQFVTINAIDPSGDGGFETGTTLAANGWSYAGHVSNNIWWAGTGAGAASGVRSGFIGISATDNNPLYPSAQVRNHMYRLVTIPPTATNVRLSFKRKQTMGESGWDFFGVYRTSTVPASGVYPPSGGIAIFGPVSDYAATNPALATFQPFGPYNLDATIGTSFYLSFTYSNGDACCGASSTGNPAVDDISLTYDIPCTPPAAITGSLSLCQYGTTTLSSATGGGTWSSSNATIATVTPSGSSTVVNGIAPGTANILYTVAGCPRSVTVTVNPAPTVNVTPATTSVCLGSGASLTATSAFGGSLTVSSGTINQGIPDASPVGGTHTLNVSGIPVGATITGVSATINLAHTWVSDMVINLKAPNNNILNLFNQHGGSGDNLTNTVISSNGVTPIASGTPPFTGTFLPAAALGGGPTGYASNVSTFSSLYSTPNGGWTLALQDLWSGDVPTLISWSVTISYSSPPPTTWSPLTGLYTNAALTTPYTGGSTLNVFAAPAANTVYSASATGGGCTTVGTSTVNVNPVPAAITGTATVCSGRTTTLSSASGGGTWSTSASGIAAVSGSGSSATITGGTAGTAVITYMFGSGCYTTRVVTVHPAPAAITGTAQLCELATTTLSHPDGGTGTWTSEHPGMATVGLTSGIVSGVSNGYATISYTNTNGCVTTRQATVNPLPAVSVMPGTSATLCLNNSQTFTASSPDPQMTLMSQDFNSGLAGWTITNGGGLAGSHWVIVTPPGLTGFAGDGTDYLQAASSASPSPNPPTVTTITSPSFSTMGGFASATLSFNQYLFSFAPPDVTASIEYSINGGSTWTLIDNQAGDVISDIGDDGNWSAASPEFSMPMPAGAMGQPDVKIRFVYTAQSLYWLIDNIKVKGTQPSSTFAWTGAAGLSCTSCPAPTITPTIAGSNSYNLAVTSSAGCVTNTPVTVSVNPLPTPIAGNLNVCDNGTSTLSSSPTGTWGVSNPSAATITSGTGVLTGVAVGTTDITYTASATGCMVTAVATVLPSPAAITPASVALCLGDDATLNTTTAGGVWSTSNSTIAPISASGTSATVSSMGTGMAGITYTMPNTCFASRDVTINPLPANIAGASSVCIGATTTLTNSDLFGTWTSANSGIASVNATTGEVMGVSQGNTTITYTLSTGCYKVKPIQVNPLPGTTVGASQICMGNSAVLSNPTSGGVWSSSAPAIASVNSSGIVTAGTVVGSANIYYTLTATGCQVAHNIDVNPLPQPIAGPSKVCKDANITLTDADPFGTWSSSDPLVAPIDAGGMVAGIAVGTARITYTLPTGCLISKVVTVNPLPNNISGNTAVCYGSTTNLLNTTPLGTWSSSDVSVATVNAVGQVAPVMATGGNVTITYMVTASGCYKTHDMIVNPLPDGITGNTTICQSTTTMLSSTSAGGTWTSANNSIMSITPASGVGTGVTAGGTTITYTLPTGCRTTTGVVVNPRPEDILGAQELCAGRQLNLSTLSIGGSWVSSDPSVATVNGSGVVTGAMVSTASTATISYVFATGCYKAEQVTVNPLPATITGNFSVCVGSSTDLSSADGGGTWTSSNPTVAPVTFFGTVSGNNAGGVIITYTLPTGCMRTQPVVVNPLPGNITGVASVCEGLTTDLNNPTANGTWSSENTFTATVDATTGLVMGVDEGTTNIVYTLPTGCARSRAVVVNPTPDPISGTMAACIGSTSALSSNPSNGTWSSSSTSVASVNALGIVTANNAGAANITYTLPAGCRTVSTFVSNPLPTTINGTRVVCKDGSSTLSNATSGGEWSSTNGSIMSIDPVSGQMTGNNAGVTSVTYTLLSTGCARSANVTVNPLPNAITGNMAVCEGATTNLATTSTGGTWSTSNASVASVNSAGVVTGNSAGSADIAYTFSTGCRTTATITVNALPNDITGASAVCFGQQATVMNTTGGGSWTVDNPLIANIDAGGVVTGLGVGTANVKFTIDLTGCYKTMPFTVNPLPAPIMGNMSVCQGSTTTLTNSTPNGTWSSSNTSIAPIGTNTGVATGFAVGFSIVQYTLPTGCSSNGTLVVNPLPEPITGTPTMCAGATTQLESNTTGGTWTTNNGVASVNPSGLVTGVAAGTSVVTYTTGNGCRRIRVVVVNPLPSVIGGASSVCPGLTTTLTNTMSGGSWMSDDMAVATVSGTGVVTPATTTGGTANIVYTLPTGCSRSKMMTVHPEVDAITGDGTVCKGGTTTLANTMTGGAWSSSNTARATVNATGDVTGVGAGIVDIAYTMPTGCKATKQMIVNPLPGNISGPAAVCDGSTVSLGNTVAGGTWATDDAMIASISSTGAVTGEDAGAAVVTYTLPTGCFTTRSIVVNSLPVVKNVTGGGAYCAGGAGMAIGLDGSQSGMLYKLMNGGSIPVLTMLGNGGVVNFGNQTGAGTYTVTAVSAEGCMQDMSGNPLIAINPLVTPSVTMASDKGNTVCAGTSVTYTATGVNGGTTPSFAWMVNGIDMGVPTAAYTYVPVHGDIVAIRFTSNETCATPTIVSTQMVMTVRENLAPTIAITAEPGNKLCEGQTAMYTAVIENGGPAPTYSWLVDGTPVAGATNTTFSYMPDNGDLVVAKLNSSYGCATVNNVSSNGITMEMATVFIPVVNVVATPGTVVPKGTEVTYTATVSNAGPTPTYQWMVNMEEITGATSPVFKTNKLNDGDSVTCKVQGTGECSQSSINSVVMTITPSTGVGTTMIGNSEIRLMPNPNSGAFTVSGTLATKADEAVNFEVTNMLGQVIYKGATTAKAGVIDAKIELGKELANGMYMLNMTVGAERKSFHFVLKQ